MREDAPSAHWTNHGPATLMLGNFNLVDGTLKTQISPVYYWFRMD